MSKYYIVLLLVLWGSGIGAQEKGFKVTYRHCVQTDTAKTLTDTTGLEAQLTVGARASNYTWLRQKAGALASDSTTKAPAPREEGSGRYVVRVGTPVDSIGNMVYYDRTSDSVWVRDKVQSGYILVREKRAPIQWKITGERKRVNQFHCLKATAAFRGRNYTAWFTPDIPVGEGPWKFKGLPGLILSLEDDRGQVKIYAEKVEYPLPVAVPAFVARGREITPAQYITIRNEEYQAAVRNIRETVSEQVGHQRVRVAVPPGAAHRTSFGIEKSLD